MLTLACWDVRGKVVECIWCMRLEYQDTLLLACQQLRMVAYFSSKDDAQRLRHIFSQYTSLFAQLAFVAFLLASSPCLHSTFYILYSIFYIHSSISTSIPISVGCAQAFPKMI